MSELHKQLDNAIGKKEGLEGGYVSRTGKRYPNYLRNEDWTGFLNNMTQEHRQQYSEGSGGELEEKQYPPKMASFGSSSRLIYELSKDIPGFIFEEKLDTKVGGIANLDGFFINRKRLTYVEAKRREIYLSHDNEEIKVNYKDVYKEIEKETKEDFKYIPIDGQDELKKKDSSTPVMKGHFALKGTRIPQFDMKQLICHFLGITYDLAKFQNSVKEVQFLYLVYNPKDLKDYVDAKVYKNLERIYQKATFSDIANQKEIEELMERIFHIILQYQIKRNNLPKMSKSEMKFTFKFVDQDNYKAELS